MTKENITLINYQTNFIDNLNSIAYGKMLENSSNKKYYFENSISKRDIFETQAKYFNFSCEFISSNRTQYIKNKYKNLNTYKNFKKEFISKKPNNKDTFLNVEHFNIEDMSYISNDIKEMFKFKNLDFIVNYDILEQINTTSSIGLYINKDDINDLDYEYIYKATMRLNKYIKNPMLFIFCTVNIQNKIKSYIPYKFINLIDWKEEFYFLTSCKHRIILNNQNSYTLGLWSGILGTKQNSTSINTINKNLNIKNLNKNWIKI